VSVATNRDELTSHAWRQLRARILAESDVCIVCGHGASDTADHVIPVSKGGARLDPDNVAPIHGVHGCPVCLRKCNSEKGDRPLANVVQLVTSVDWFAGP
jgi:5-methylcytosine-specific restriction endonuclease McrA